MSQSRNAQPDVTVPGPTNISISSPGIPSWLKRPGGAAQEPETHYEFGHVGDEMKRLHDQIQDSHHTVNRTWRLAEKLKGTSILDQHNHKALVKLTDILNLEAAHPEGLDHARSLLEWQVIKEEFTCFKNGYLDTRNSWKGDHEDPCWRHVDFMVRQGDKQRDPKQTLPDFYQMNPRAGWSIDHYYANFVLVVLRRIDNGHGQHPHKTEAIQWLREEKLIRMTNSREWMLYHVLMFLHMQERAKLRADTHWARKGWWEVRRLPVWHRIENSASYRKNKLKQCLKGISWWMIGGHGKGAARYVEYFPTGRHNLDSKERNTN
jgi:hypothetical protein